MRTKIFCLLIGSMAMLRCATTEIGSATDRQYKSNTYTRVIFVSTISNLIQKQQIEESFLDASSDLNVEGYISMRILPPTRDYTTAEIEEVLDRYKIDGILFIALQDYWETNVYIPGGSQVKASALLIGNTLHFSAVKANLPGTMISAPNAIFECRFFDSRTQNFVWRSTSRTSGDVFADFSTLTSSLSQTTIDRLVQDSIFRSKHEVEIQQVITELQATEAISAAENLYISGKIGEAISKVGGLDPKITNSNSIAEKGKLLARISFLRGAYFFQKKNDVAAMKNWGDANGYDPGFVPLEIFGIEIKKKYQDFIEFKKNEEINKREMRKLESDKISKSDLIRIIKDGAALRLEPSNESLVIKLLPLGGVLKVDDVIEDWIKIVLPVDKDGIPIVGYLHVSFVKKIIR